MTNSTKNKNITCITWTDLLAESPSELTISGERGAVLRAIAAIADLPPSEIEIRRNPQSDDGLPLLVVDRAQAESYPACVGEVLS